MAMTIIVDASLWVALFKDRSGRIATLINVEAGAAHVVMVPPIRLELLQGCRGDIEWRTMLARVDAFELLPFDASTWDAAARIYFDLRQTGITVRSTIDCCIAQLALHHNCTLLHDDRDFEKIATIRTLKHLRLDLSKA
jgi:predicted nucleic acid-binding protein